MKRTETSSMLVIVEASKVNLVPFVQGQLIIVDNGDVYYDPTTGTSESQRVQLIQSGALALKQDITDNSLSTEDKTISGAINELFAKLQNDVLDKLGAASGIATLGSDSKVLTEQLPEAVVGAVSYQGVWNAADGTDGSGTEIPAAKKANKGWYFITATPGEWNGITFQSGDWLISDGSNWSRIDTASDVNSVNGKTGAVTLTAADIGLGNVTNESKATMFENPTFTGTVTVPTQEITDASAKAASTKFVSDFVNDAIGDASLQTIINNGSTYTGSKILEMRNATAAAKLSAGVIQLTSISGETETVELKIDPSTSSVITGSTKVKNAIINWLGAQTSIPTLSAVVTAGATVSGSKDTTSLAEGNVVVNDADGNKAIVDSEGVKVYDGDDIAFKVSQTAVTGSDTVKNAFNTFLGNNIVRITE